MELLQCYNALEREETLLQSRSDTFSREKKSKFIMALDQPRSQATGTDFSERDFEILKDRLQSFCTDSLLLSPHHPAPQKKV